jgi:hypothetical protein
MSQSDGEAIVAVASWLVVVEPAAEEQVRASLARLPGAVGDTFSVATRLVEPRTDLRGMRASRDLASQLLDHLVEMEQAYLAGR